MACLTLLLCLVWVLPAGATGPLPTLPADAVARLNLQFYRVPDSLPPAGLMPPGSKMIPFWGADFVVSAAPLFTTDDILRVEWQAATQFVSSRGDLAGGPFLNVVFRPESLCAKLAQQDGGCMLITAGDQAFALSERLTASGVASFRFIALPCDRQAALLPCLKGFPCSAGLPVADALGRPAVLRIPGLARVRVTGRFADGSKSSSLRCAGFNPRLNKHAGQYGTVVPTVFQGDGEFTVINVTPGEWRGTLAGDDFAPCDATRPALEITPGADVQLRVRLHPGATISGRIVSAENGQPLEGVEVVGGNGPVKTDAEGRYCIPHVSPDRVYLLVYDGCHVPQFVTFDCLRDGGACAAPDLPLQSGGMICGQVLRQPEMTRDLSWYAHIMPDLPAPERYLYAAHFDPKTFTFRMGPIPAGAYDLRGVVVSSKLDRSDPRQRWAGWAANVEVETGQEVNDVVLPVVAEAIK